MNNLTYITKSEDSIINSAAAPIAPTPPISSKASANSSSSHFLSPLLKLLKTVTSTSRTHFGVHETIKLTKPDTYALHVALLQPSEILPSSALTMNSRWAPRMKGRFLEAEDAESTPQANAPERMVK
ncbi:hypothetical protein Hanom_Chr11g01023411 [Helianthus anomalus]